MLNFWLNLFTTLRLFQHDVIRNGIYGNGSSTKSNARHQGLISFFSPYLVISIKFLSLRDIIKIYREKFSSRLLHQLVEMEMEKYGYSFLSSIGLEGDMKCANVYFCCLGFIRGYLKSSETKKSWIQRK